MAGFARLFEILSERRIRSIELSKAIGVSTGTISDWKYQRGTPNIEVLNKIAEYLCVSTDYLLGRIDTPSIGGENTSFEKKIVTLPLFNSPVSAGIGEWLNSDEFEEKKFNADKIPENADFALIIRGDSMEPKYIDGDIVFIKQDVIVEQNQIGIFCLNGSGYIKKIVGNYLMSLNKKYQPIEIGEFDSFYTVGRVIGKI